SPTEDTKRLFTEMLKTPEGVLQVQKWIDIEDEVRFVVTEEVIFEVNKDGSYTLDENGKKIPSHGRTEEEKDSEGNFNNLLVTISLNNIEDDRMSDFNDNEKLNVTGVHEGSHLTK